VLATLFLLFFLFTVPKHFKKMGIHQIIHHKRKQGVFLFLTSKIVWWFIFIQLSIIWLNDYLLYIEIFVAVAFLYRIIQDRKYLFFRYKK